MSDKRTFIRINPDGSEWSLPIAELRKGDSFRIETDEPEDHLYGQQKQVWYATADPTKPEGGVWMVRAKPENGPAVFVSMLRETNERIEQIERIRRASRAEEKSRLRSVERVDDEDDRLRPFEVGDVVRLRSGGPLMTVVETTHGDNHESKLQRLTCAWIRDNGDVERETFPAPCLLLDRPAKALCCLFHRSGGRSNLSCGGDKPVAEEPPKARWSPPTDEG